MKDFEKKTSNNDWIFLQCLLSRPDNFASKEV